MNNPRLLNRIDKAWEAFLDSMEGLSEEEMLKPGVSGDWSVRDIIAHVTSWEEEALKALPLILAEKRLPRYSDLYGGINAFNDLMTEKNRLLPLEEVIRKRDETHQRLRDYVGKTETDKGSIQTRFRRRLGFDSHRHYHEHTEAILAWRGKKWKT